jgi:hypothetical protein
MLYETRFSHHVHNLVAAAKILSDTELLTLLVHQSANDAPSRESDIWDKTRICNND